MTNLHTIVRTILLQRGKSLHWYFPYLVYCRDGFRELLFDDLKVVNTVPIQFDIYNEACLPKDFEDIVNIGSGISQNIGTLVADNTLNPLLNFDNNGNRVGYLDFSSNSNNPRDNYLIGYEGSRPYFNQDYWGVYGGRWYGGGYSDTYTIIRERNKIKINENLYSGGNNWVLQYIGDGSSCNAASIVDSYAIATINAYADWWIDYGGKSGTAGEFKYLRERKILRARKSDLTPAGIKRAMDAAYSLVP